MRFGGTAAGIQGARVAGRELANLTGPTRSGVIDKALGKLRTDPTPELRAAVAGTQGAVDQLAARINGTPAGLRMTPDALKAVLAGDKPLPSAVVAGLEAKGMARLPPGTVPKQLYEAVGKQPPLSLTHPNPLKRVGAGLGTSLFNRWNLPINIAGGIAAASGSHTPYERVTGYTGSPSDDPAVIELLRRLQPEVLHGGRP